MTHAIISLLAIALLTVHSGPHELTKADKVRDSEWFLDYLNIREAHKLSKGSEVLVALPDSGVDPHDDLKENLLPGADLSTAEPGTGQSDSIGHGTEMAGLIAGHGRGLDKGLIGIAPAAQILPIKVYSRDESAPALGRGIEFATDSGAKVINVSASVGPSRSMQSAIDAAKKADALVVASAGNETKGTLFGYPAAIPGVLAVGAITRAGQHAELSVTGPNISLCAPGIDITTTGAGSTYRTVRGTSAAAAITSGAAALVRSKFPELSAQEVIHRLTYTATDIGPPGRDDECGFGVLNIVKALTAEVPPLASTASPSVGSSGGATPSAPREDSGSMAGAPRSDSSGSALLAIVGGGAAIGAVGVLLALFVSRRRRRP